MQNECACGAYKKASSVGFAATFSEGRRLTDTETANINGERRAGAEPKVRVCALGATSFRAKREHRYASRTQNDVIFDK